MMAAPDHIIEGVRIVAASHGIATQQVHPDEDEAPLGMIVDRAKCVCGQEFEWADRKDAHQRHVNRMVVDYVWDEATRETP